MWNSQSGIKLFKYKTLRDICLFHYLFVYLFVVCLYMCFYSMICLIFNSMFAQGKRFNSICYLIG